MVDFIQKNRNNRKTLNDWLKMLFISYIDMKT